MNTKTQPGLRAPASDSKIEKPTNSLSTTLIQNDLPQHHLHPNETSTAAGTAFVQPSKAKEKWSSLKSNLSSAVNDWVELEKKPSQKTPEEEQLEKVRSLISNLKERLAES